MPFVHIPTGATVDRTFEELSGGCTIARAESQHLGWDYDGSGTDVFWDDAQPRRNAQGEPLYLTQAGAVVPHSQIGWQDEDDTGNPAANARVTPLPPEDERPHAARRVLRLTQAERDTVVDALRAAVANGAHIPHSLLQQLKTG